MNATQELSEKDLLILEGTDPRDAFEQLEALSDGTLARMAANIPRADGDWYLTHSWEVRK